MGLQELFVFRFAHTIWGKFEYLEMVEDSKEYRVRNTWGKPRKVEFPANGVLEQMSSEVTNCILYFGKSEKEERKLHGFFKLEK